MSRHSEDMTTLNTRQPKELKEQLVGALRDGETISDFLRAAIVRELRRRGKKVEMPDVQMGRPKSE